MLGSGRRGQVDEFRQTSYTLRCTVLGTGSLVWRRKCLQLSGCFDLRCEELDAVPYALR